jgi:hypothetical protein
MDKRRLIIVCSAVAIVISIILFLYASNVISTIQDIGYTKVTVSNYAAATVKLGDKTYIFEYYPPELAIIPLGQIIYQVRQGATYSYSGLEVKISEVHSNYIVLLVK